MESSTPNQPPPRAQRRGGFTLIELLLVTVILGLLASITAPYLGAAKEQHPGIRQRNGGVLRN